MPRAPQGRTHLFAVRRFIPFYAVATLLSVAAGGAGSLARQAQRLVHGFVEREVREFRFVVFLEDHSDRPGLEEQLLTTPGVRFARFVTKEEALGRAQDIPVLAEGLKLTGRNPLPESFEITWASSFLRPDVIRPVADRWESIDGVARVGFDAARLERLALLHRVGGQLDVIMSVLLWIAMVAAAGWMAYLLFWNLGPLPWPEALAGLGMGLAGGALGMLAVWGWTSVWEPAGVVAGGLVGMIAGLGRGLPRW